MSRKPVPKSGPAARTKPAQSRKSSTASTTSESHPPKRSDAGGAWVLTHPGGIVERLGRVVEVGSAGKKSRQATIDEVLIFLRGRAAATPLADGQAPAALPPFDLAVWKDGRLVGYVRAEARGTFTVRKIK